MLLRILLFVALLLSPLCAKAQPSPQNAQTQTFYAFTKIGRGTDISATTVSSRQTITAAPVAMVYNSGSVTAYVAPGSVTVTVTAANGVPVPPGSCVALNVTGATNIAGITGSGTAILQVTTGTGVFGGCGGGLGSGGGGSSASIQSQPYNYTPLTPGQFGLGIVTSTALTVPSGALQAVVCAAGQSVNYTYDGTTVPTSSVGMLLASGQCIQFSGGTVLANLRFIQIAATATLNVSYTR